MASFISVTHSSHILTNELSGLVGDVPATVLALDCTGSEPSESWEEKVEAPSREILRQLGSAGADSNAQPIIAVVRLDPEHERRVPFQVSALAAVKGAVGTASVEFAADDIRVNVIALTSRTDPSDIDSSIRYLADDAVAGFTTGVTIDLTMQPASRMPPESATAGVALVTGAGGTLGRAAAKALVAGGHDVVVTDLGSAGLDTTAETLGVEAIPCDVTLAADLERLARHPRLQDGLSSLVVYHGVDGPGAIREFDEAPLTRSLRVNGTGVWKALHHLLPALKLGSPGSVVVLSSQAGLVPEKGNGPYCTGKFAVVGLVRALAGQELGGVRVHALCPGPIETPLMRRGFHGMAESAGISAEEYFAQRMREVPLGRFGAPHQIGEASRFLSELASTGVVLASTGGVVHT